MVRMSFTEIVFEVADDRYPLCRHTRVPADAFAIYRLVDDGRTSRCYRVHVSYHGPPEQAAEVVRDMTALRAEDQVEVTFQRDGHVALSIASPIEEGRPPTRGFVAAAAILQTFGVDTLLEPVIFTQGRARARFIVPRPLDTQDALRSLQEIQRVCGFAGFRVLRTTTVDAGSHLDLARRILPSEQEELLRLAAAMGYYDTPKRATLEQVAGRVGLSISPVHKRLKAAEESLVAAHVRPAPREAASAARRRREVRRFDDTQPWEIAVRVHAPRMGPAGFIAQVPGAQSLLHILSEDKPTGTVSLLLNALVPEEFQVKLLSSLEDRPEILESTVLTRERSHVSVRLVTRGRSGYGFSWWTEVWGGDATLRPIVFDEEGAILRILLLRPQTEEAFLRKLEEASRYGDWTGHEIVSVRPLGATLPPPSNSDPLTQRQLEVLRVAHALGYYQTPRVCTLEQVANTLGVSANAIRKNLVLAESKLISAYLAAGL
jgi:predicted DNA binding protein